MVFSSTLFLFYFLPAFLLLYYFSPPKFKNHTLLLASILFYSWGGPVFIFAIFITTLLDFIFVKQIEKSQTQKRKKTFLCISLVMNLGLLFTFKYLYFFTSNIDLILSYSGHPPTGMEKLILPIGVSFFTFESLTYVLDVYRGDYKSLKSFTNYLTYILLFPKLIAGPIIPYNKIGWQIESERKTTAEMRLSGMLRFIFGLSKKVLIANVIGETVEGFYKLDPSAIDMATAWAMSVGYTMQLYFDFSGYSDMAIGICKMVGISIPENFNFPYISRSITEFWRRWHISLGNWMRNYLYIPLGGSKGSVFRTYMNLWLVFLISGFWHGGNWNFILWGAYNGFFLMIERLFLGKYLKSHLSLIYTFFIANIGWVFFRNEDLGVAKMVLQKMFSFQLNPGHHPDGRFLFFLSVALLISFSGVIKPFYRTVQDDDVLFIENKWRLNGLFVLGVVLAVLSSAYLLGQDFNPFIYFRF